MGLDGVELVMEVEDEFEIVIPDAGAAEVVTVGDLVDVVHARLRRSNREPCPSQHGFYVVRKSLMGRLGIARSSIRPDTKLDVLVAKPGRRAGTYLLLR